MEMHGATCPILQYGGHITDSCPEFYINGPGLFNMLLSVNPIWPWSSVEWRHRTKASCYEMHNSQRPPNPTSLWKTGWKKSLQTGTFSVARTGLNLILVMVVATRWEETCW